MSERTYLDRDIPDDWNSDRLVEYIKNRISDPNYHSVELMLNDQNEMFMRIWSID